MSRTRIGLAGLTLAAVCGALYLTQASSAGDAKAMGAAVDKIADAIRKGDKAGAKKQADALAKNMEEVAELMDLFKPKKKGGLGFGDSPTTGIEQTLLKVGRDAPAAGSLAKDAAAYEQMGYRIAAIADVTHAKAPAKDQGKKTRKDWTTWSDDMREGAIALAAAGKAKGAQDIKSAAAKVNASCNSCHSAFR